MLFENLESRRLYSITHSLDAAGTLTVQGDGANDVITVQESGGYLVVSQNSPDLTWYPRATIASLATISTPVLYTSARMRLPPPGSYSLSAVQRIVVRGGSGDDLITVNSSIGATIEGNDGNDTIYAGFGNDLVDGGAGNDAVNGRWGNDIVTGGDGSDVVHGDEGDDLLDATHDRGGDIYSGGAGTDHLSYAGRTSSITIDPNDGFAGDGESGFGFFEQDNVGSDIEDFTGGSANDSIVGTPGPNTIHGGPGEDRLNGGDGNDSLFGDDGSDVLMGKAGDDWVVGGAGDDWVIGDDGNDTLIGNEGRDFLFGGNGDDVLDARDGNVETVDGGAGFDTAYVDRHGDTHVQWIDEELNDVEWFF